MIDSMIAPYDPQAYDGGGHGFCPFHAPTCNRTEGWRLRRLTARRSTWAPSTETSLQVRLCAQQGRRAHAQCRCLCRCSCQDAVLSGLLPVGRVAQHLTDAMAIRFRLGLFDPQVGPQSARASAIDSRAMPCSPALRRRDSRYCASGPADVGSDAQRAERRSRRARDSCCSPTRTRRPPVSATGAGRDRRHRLPPGTGRGPSPRKLTCRSTVPMGRVTVSRASQRPSSGWARAWRSRPAARRRRTAPLRRCAVCSRAAGDSLSLE